MSVENVQERVKNIIVEQLGVEADQVKPEAQFVNDLGADSLDTVELIMALEEEFDIEIPDDKAEKIKTVADSAGIASFVYGHFQPLSTQRKIVRVTSTVVEKKSPPARE